MENAVRVRTEAGTSSGDRTVLFTPVVDQELDIRPDVETVEADGYTWIPIIADDQDAWIAQEGFVELVTEMVDEPISQAEIDEACDSELPEGASEIVAIDNQLQAVDANGVVVAVWYWGDETRDTFWGSATSFDNAPEDYEEFLSWYKFQPGDQVELVRTGRGTPQDVSDYWTLSITRDGITRSELPVAEQRFGGYVRPLGMSLEHPEFPEVENVDLFFVDVVYIGHYKGSSDTGTGEIDLLVFALPSQDTIETRIIEVEVPEGLPIWYSLLGDGPATDSSEVMEQLDIDFRTGNEVEIYLNGYQDSPTSALGDIWIAGAFTINCAENQTCVNAVHNSLYSESLTDPNDIYRWWQTRIVTGNNSGPIRTSGISTIISAPPLGTTWEIN